MKTRIISTDIWDSEEIFNLNIDTKVLYLFLLTNSYIGQSRIFKISDRLLSAYTGLNLPQLSLCKKQLEDKGLITFHKELWVKINTDIGYVESRFKGRLNEIARNRELTCIPDDVRKSLDVSITPEGLGLVKNIDKRKYNLPEEVVSKIKERNLKVLSRHDVLGIKKST
jgi:hypothetical protein